MNGLTTRCLTPAREAVREVVVDALREHDEGLTVRQLADLMPDYCDDRGPRPHSYGEAYAYLAVLRLDGLTERVAGAKPVRWRWCGA